jgi:cytochrome c oxidase subunit IV
MSDHTSHSDGHHGFAHPMPVKHLLAVFFALILLTILTVFQSTLDLGNSELIISLFIATIKASLVILFFMHMIHDKPLNAIVFLSSFIFVALFLGFTLTDAHSYKDNYEFKNVPSPPPAVASSEPGKPADAH